MRLKTILLLSIPLLLSCEKTDDEGCSESPGLYTLSDFPVGVAVDLYELENNPRYAEIVINQFNSVTAENIFKPGYLHPLENQFDWTEADRLVEFCQVHGKRLHGHTLIWHNQLPDWMENFQGTETEWDQLFKHHIQSICTHFKGKVGSWDVVNEAFNDDGTLRNTIWLQYIGISYIEKAFQYAHEADPDALLFYNDYNIAQSKEKRDTIIRFFTDLRGKGIPVDGIGMQMHISIHYPSNQQIEDALTEMADNDFKIHLSELDISVNPFGQDIEPSDQLFELQASKLAYITLVFKSLPIQSRHGMTFWGVSDKNSWIRYYFQRMDYPLLYDDNYKPKPAYCKMREVL